MNECKDSKVFWSVQVIGICLSLMACTVGIVGCSNTHKERQDAVYASFSNQTVQVKATTYFDQFIVRCEDGSIWEVKVSTDFTVEIKSPYYKNCLFDSLIKPQIQLEK